jgi:myo-inositol-1(or 4)-monophosphatase
VVDPLDGTTNYLHGFPVVGVSVALVEDGRPAVGVVHAPFLGQTFLAARGLGARVRKGGAVVEARVSGRPVEQAVVGTGFPFRRKDILPRYLAAFEACLERFEDLRRPGAAALDLAWVAAGVFEGFFELGLAPWDVAAGALLIEEAGGVVSDWEGGPGYLGGDILAGSLAVHAALLEIVRHG